MTRSPRGGLGILRRGGPVAGPLLLATLLGAATAGAAEPGPVPDKAQVLEARRALYLQVQRDPAYLAFRERLRGRFDDRELIDSYLEWLPLSPLHLLEMDMRQRKYEMAVPRFIHAWHQRWLELHDAGGPAERGAGKRMVMSPAGGLVAPPPAAGDAGVGPNRNMAADFADPPEEYQGEIQLVVNPANPLEIVAASNTWDEDGGRCGDFGLQAVFYSDDGGTSWGYSCPPDGPAYGLRCDAYGGGTLGSDPALSWDDRGNVYLQHMLLCATPTDTLFSMVVARSSDGGRTWAPRGLIKDSFATGDVEDKNFYAIDNHRESPYHGRHYTCWDRNNDEKIAYSDDAGKSWTEVDLPTTEGTCGANAFFRYDLGCEMAVDDDGTLYVIYDTLQCGFADCTCEQMYFSRSTNGGESWSAPRQIANFNLVSFSLDDAPPAQDERGIGPLGALDVDTSGGPCDGTLYITYGDHTGGGAATSDVWVIRSRDRGATWSQPVLVNDDGPGGKCQFHPFLVVDPTTGQPVVAWHDARNDPGNRKVDFYVDRSTDCGATFGRDVQVTAPSGEFPNRDVSWSDQNTRRNSDANPNQYGEYLGLDARGGKAYVAWTDTRNALPDASADLDNQKENIGFAVVDFGAAVCNQNGVCEPGESCSTCPGDCIGGGGGSCGNGLCEAAAGEDCASCAADCRRGGGLCCGAGGLGACSDARCSAGGWQCSAAAPRPFCCGNGRCEAPNESALTCALDCG